MLTLWFSLVVSVPPDTAFTPFHREDQVQVSLARKPDPLPWVRGEGEVPGPLTRVAELLKDLANYHRLFEEFIETSSIVEKKDGVIRVHLVWPFPIFFRDRDAVVSYEAEAQPPLFSLKWKRSEQPGDPHDGRRIDRVEGMTVLRPQGEQVRVTYTYYGDLGGDFSESTKDSAYRAQPLKYFGALRKAVTQTGK